MFNKIFSLIAITAITFAPILFANPINDQLGSNAIVELFAIQDGTQFQKHTADSHLTYVRLDQETNSQISVDAAAIKPVYTTRFTLGGHVYNDRLVSQTKDNTTYSKTVDVKRNMDYPSGGGLGAVLSFIEIFIQHNSTNIEAYVVGGGIGQRWIKIIVEAYKTIKFNHVSNIFGV